MNQTQFAAEVLRDWQRNAVVQALAYLGDETRDIVARKLYGSEGADAVLKASVNPASTTGWGSATAGQRVAAFLSSLRPRSAAAELFDRSLRVDMSGVNTVSLPRGGGSYPEPAWVAEGDPIPAQRGDLASATLGPPGKLAAIAGLTQELRDLSAEDAETIISDIMRDAAARALDSSVFSATAASALRPAGILAGITAKAATAGGGVNALAGDVRSLVQAIHDVGGGADIVLFAAPAQAASYRILAPNSNLPMINAPSLAAGTVIAIDAAAFASGFSDVPRVDVARDALIHWDTAPAQIGTAGTPNVVAAPTRSGFQSDIFAIKLVLRGAWSLRLPGAAQFVAGATW